MRGLVLTLLALSACAPRADRTMRTLGVLGVRNGIAYAVDLTVTQPPHEYVLICGNVLDENNAGCPFSPGKTYTAMFQNEKWDAPMVWIEYAGQRSLPMYNTFECIDPNSHWEWNPAATGDESPVSCVPGTDDPVSWRRDDGSEQMAARYGELPTCIDQPSLLGQSLTVVIKVVPPPGREWTFDEAPGLVAASFLSALNSSGLQLSEANGVQPDMYLDVVLDQRLEGTEQDTATVELGKPGHSVLLHETSGDVPFTSVTDALGALAGRVAGRLLAGWQAAGPCRAPNGTVRE